MATTVADQPVVPPTTEQIQNPAQEDIPVPSTEEIPLEENQTMSEVHKYEYDVKMTCNGCSGAVTRVLTKAEKEGLVEKFDVNLETQRVEVIGTIPFDALTERIRKTGKEIRSAKEITV